MCPSGWFFFGDRYWKHRHDNFQAIFRIVRLISNCSLKQLSPSHSHKKDVITKFENNFFFIKTGNGMRTSWSAYCIFGTVYCSLLEVPREKSKTKPTLTNFTLPVPFKNHFFKAFYERTNGQRFSYKKNYYGNEVYTGIA